MRVAAIDIGTNTVLLLVAERDAEGALRAVAERATITRLGEGVDRNRRLSAAAIARTRGCLEEYARVVQEFEVERTAVVGTSAMRDARGGDDLCEQVQVLFGSDLRVLSGDEEARLAFRGALSGLSSKQGRELAVFDIGGGSTEVVLGHLAPMRPRIAFSSSFDVGSVRMTERYVRHDPPQPGELDLIQQAARQAFAAVPYWPPSTPVGIAGTMTTLGAVHLRLAPYDGARMHGYTMRTEDVAAVVLRLSSLDLASRRCVAGLDPKRADVIVAGGVIALALLDQAGAKAVRISDRGVRWGLAEDLASYS